MGDEAKAGQNPDWVYEELLLALDLYLRGTKLSKTHPEVVELSALLQSLPIHPIASRTSAFRNPEGVNLKLANIASIDPNHPGKGMSRGGAGDREIWRRFANDRQELARQALLIRADAAAGRFPPTPDSDELEVAEGRLYYRLHLARERNQAAVKRKKELAVAAEGRLRCEACGFVFAEVYGDLAPDYIECHHILPLAISGETKTRAKDLALLCANCHRAIHRDLTLSVADLRALVGLP